MKLELTEEERFILEEVLSERIGEIHPEIRRSMDHEFKDSLRHKLEVMESLLERVKMTRQQSASS